MPRDRREEVVIIDKILKFNEFERFYRIEWETRNISIDWWIDPSCPQFALFSFEDGKPFIELRHMPNNLNDAFLVAHEMVHVMKHHDGEMLEFMMSDLAARKIGQREIGDLAARFGSMFDDPIVDSFLQNKYNFNPAHFYAKIKVPDTIKSLNSHPEAIDDLYRLKQALLYSQFALQFDSIIDEKALREWRKLKRLYQRKRPNVTRMGEELYTITKENGYDTIERQRAVFNKIADVYNIKGVVLKDILVTK